MAAKKPTEQEGEVGGEELRTMFSPPWACMAKCGACCYLAPEERDLSGLTDEERDTYIGMAGEDGWCLNFDRATHLCKIYEDRPSFCRIESLGPMYDVPEDELGDFAADSCRDHIGQLYGSESDEILRYEALQDSVREAAGWVKMEDDFELVAESDMRDGASTRAELLQARRQVLLALDSVSCGETDAAAGLRDVLQQLDAAIAALDTGE